MFFVLVIIVHLRNDEFKLQGILPTFSYHLIDGNIVLMKTLKL